MRLLLLPLLCISIATQAMGQHPVLNEVMSGNTRTLEDEDGDFSDWIELYNPTDATLSLGGYGLSDDADEPFKWTMPPQTLDAGSHALVFASSKDRPGNVHHRTGEACPVCGDVIREVAYSRYTVHYCPTCQTGGKVLADNTTSKFLK